MFPSVLCAKNPTVDKRGGGVLLPIVQREETPLSDLHGRPATTDSVKIKSGRIEALI